MLRDLVLHRSELVLQVLIGRFLKSHPCSLRLRFGCGGRSRGSSRRGRSTGRGADERSGGRDRQRNSDQHLIGFIGFASTTYLTEYGN